MGLIYEENDEQMVERLAGKAGNIIAMLRSVFTTPEGLDIATAIIFAAGLAGYACHEAVCAEHGTFAVVTTKNGEKYYFGDGVNKYLLESRTSVIGFCNAIADLPEEKVLGIIASFAQGIGSEDMAVCGLKPAELYEQIDQCWKGIFHNMTDQYCQSPSEWPVLFGIVTQNLLVTAYQAGAPKEEATGMAIECAAALSKMGKDTFGEGRD